MRTQIAEEAMPDLLHCIFYEFETIINIVTLIVHGQIFGVFLMFKISIDKHLLIEIIQCSLSSQSLLYHAVHLPYASKSAIIAVLCTGGAFLGGNMNKYYLPVC